MALKHSFWILSDKTHPKLMEILNKRIANPDSAVLLPCEMSESVELMGFLRFATEGNDTTATHVSDKMMLEHFQSFLSVRILRDGHIPCRGFPMDGMGVIPPDSLTELIEVLSLLPPCATWTRLTALFQQASHNRLPVLYRGIVRGMM